MKYTWALESLSSTFGLKQCLLIRRALWNDSTQMVTPLIHCGFKGIISRSWMCTEQLLGRSELMDTENKAGCLSLQSCTVKFWLFAFTW